MPAEKSGSGAHAVIVTFLNAIADTDVFPTPQALRVATGQLFGQPYPSQFVYPTTGSATTTTSPGDPGNAAYTSTDPDSNLPAGGTAMLNTTTTPAVPDHAVSDVGIGFITPVFALDRDIRRDPVNGGVGLVTIFDGSKSLPPQNTLIEARVAAAYAANTVNLYWATNPPPALDFRNLWIPTAATTLWLAAPAAGAPGGDRAHYPGYDGAAGAVSAVPPVTTALRDYIVPSSNPALKDGTRFQFLFTLDDGLGHVLPLVYQDPADPSAVRPFGYDLHSIIAQRGEVTITNNVINPVAGQVASLHYVQPGTGAVTITVFDLSGNVITVLARGQQAAGTYTTSWDGKNRSGAPVARGIYFIRVTGPGFDEIRKVLVVR